MKSKSKFIILLFILFISIDLSSWLLYYHTKSNYDLKIEDEIINIKNSSVYTNATIISDGYQDIYWNDHESRNPDIAIDANGNTHIVWNDATNGEWGYDREIMYVNYTSSAGWTNVTVISDGYQGEYWNDGESRTPSIAVENSGTIHVVWSDITDGPWRANVNNAEIMYANYTSSGGWSNATVISDGYQGIYWNDERCSNPSIAAEDSGYIHVVWDCDGTGAWGTDVEIMYAKYTPGGGWSNVSVISDGYSGIYWNDAYSGYAEIAVDYNGEAHVVWEDYTDGSWGIDIEIMYVKYTSGMGWSNITVISDGYGGIYWNDDASMCSSIEADPNGNLHVAWQDYDDGVWGTDTEILYINYTVGNGWSNVTAISDGYKGIYWNNDYSGKPSLECDSNGNIHVVWEDYCNGVWGTDVEIMHVMFSSKSGWSNVTVISDGYDNSYWNDGESVNPSIAIDNDGNTHIVWEDDTNGVWTQTVDDDEIMYTFADFLSPNITINSPRTDKIYGNTAPYFEIIINDGDLNETWYSLYNGSAWSSNYKIGSFTDQIDLEAWNNCPNGTVIVRFYANDTLGNLGSSEMTLRKDIIAPRISVIAPIDNGVYGSEAPNFNLSINESNLNESWYSIYNGTHWLQDINITGFLTGQIDPGIWVDCPNDNLILRFFSNDLGGNFNFSEIIIIKKVGKWQLLPLVIDDGGEGNFTWAEASTKAWCKGSGTLADPYMIDDIIINGQNLSTCIEIRNSNASFVISNSTFYNSLKGNNFAGIKFVEVINGKILNNNCSSNNGNGIHLELCQNITLSNNEVNNNKYAGIVLYQCEFNLIHNNKNSINNNSLYGIFLDKSNNNTISNNTINKNQIGVFLNDSFNNVIMFNIFQGNEISILESESCEDKNIIYNNQDDSISDGRNKIPDDLLIVFIVVIIVSSLVLIIVIIFIRKKYDIFHFKSTEMAESIEESVIEPETIPESKKIAPPFKLFLSYSTLDSEFFQIRKTVKNLEKFPEVSKVYYWEADSGENIVEYMERTLNKCNVFVLFCSQNTLNSNAVKDEWQAAFQLRKKGQLKIVPVYKEERFIPALLTPILNVKFEEDNFKDYVEKLYKEILRV